MDKPLCGHAGNLGPEDCLICIKNEQDEIKFKGETAIKSLFEFEQSLGPFDGNEIRKQVYRARIMVVESLQSAKLRFKKI